tara:strand:- start:54 stop:386 length:333 start_codon:yes stop_codon:yes gene_type:complete
MAAVVPIKEGFCWPAFLFSLIWALWHRLWIVTLGLVAANLVISVLLFQIGTNEAVTIVVSFSIALMLGFMGNDFRRSKLKKYGYTERGLVLDRTAEAAVRQYLEARMGDK